MARKHSTLGTANAPCPICAGRRTFVLGGAAVAAAAAAPAIAQAPAARPGLIDIHHHAVPDFWLEAAKALISVQTSGHIQPQWYGWTPEKSLAAMDAQNVAMALLSISSPGTWFGDQRAARALTRRSNERLAEVAHARPDRFGFHAALALPDVEGSLAEIDHAYDVLKADGIGVMTSYDGKNLGDKAFERVYAALNARKAVVYVHPVAPACCAMLSPDVSPNFIEFLHDTNRAILNLMFSGTLHRYRDIRWIFSHSGGSLPMMVGRINNLLVNSPETAAKVPEGFVPEMQRLYFDVANAATRAAYGALRETVPVTHVVFGSDFPIVPIQGTTNNLNGLGLSAEDYGRIAQGNALSLYPQLATRLRKPA